MAGRILQYSDLENAFDRPTRIGRVAGIIEHRRDPETVVVGVGDTIAPGVLSLYTEGRHALEFYDSVRPDLETIGNHDFDYGLEALLDIIGESPQTWVASNLFEGDTVSRTEDPPLGVDSGVVSSAIRESDGTTLGFFGVVDPTAVKNTPSADGVVATDPIERARSAISGLRSHGAEQVLALSHLGSGDDRLASETDVDVVLGAHIHTPRLEYVGDTLLTRPGANGANVVEIQFEGDQWVGKLHETKRCPIDESVATVVDTLATEVGLDTIVGVTDSTIQRGDIVRNGPCYLGTLIAESYRWWTGADVGLQNSGGIRDGPALTGPVTTAELISIVPFEEPVSVLEVTGSKLRSVLDERDGRTLDGVPDEKYMGHVAGVSDNGDTPVLRETPIDPDATYTLATTDFLRHTDREFPTITGYEPIAITEKTQYEIFVEYVRTNGFPTN